MTLSQKQRLFAYFVGKLLIYCYEVLGYEVTLGEAERKKLEAALNASQGDGIVNSNHLIRLAIDLNLFIDGMYCSDTAAHKPLGDYWKSLSDPVKGIICCWGGDFPHKPDGNHYSFEHNGVK